MLSDEVEFSSSQSLVDVGYEGRTAHEQIVALRSSAVSRLNLYSPQSSPDRERRSNLGVVGTIYYPMTKDAPFDAKFQWCRDVARFVQGYRVQHFKPSISGCI